MTMFSAEKRRFYGGFPTLGSNLVYQIMTTTQEERELRNDSVEESREDDQWLQLGIGTGTGNGGGRPQDLVNRKNNGPGSGLVKLDLMPSSSNNSSSNHSQIQPEFAAPRQHQEISWAFRPIPMPSSSFPRPFQIYAAGLEAAAVDFRVVQPPRRPHSGLWFMLQASHNQEKQPFLPQINKSFLRIKDGRMTIRLVIKYLVNKLSLENESEIEIRCKGQRLVPFLTLQHVRDNIWSSPRDFITLLPNSSPTHHIMVLHYARTHSSN